MANKIQHKRSAVTGKVPTIAQLDLGEFAVNTFDGKVYIKKDDGSASVVEIGASSAPTNFVGLTDTPASYTGEAGKLITIKPDESGIMFSDPTPGTAVRVQHFAIDGQDNFLLGGDLAANALVTVNGVVVTSEGYDNSVAGSIHFVNPLKANDLLIVLNNAPGGSSTVDLARFTFLNTLAGIKDSIQVNSVDMFTRTPTDDQYKRTDDTKLLMRDNRLFLYSGESGKTEKAQLSVASSGAVAISVTDRAGTRYDTSFSGGQVIFDGLTIAQINSTDPGNEKSAVTKEWVQAQGGGGSTTFVDLTDTPANYTGDAGKSSRVNAAANALEFVDAPKTSSEDTLAGGMQLAVVAAVPATFDANTIYFVTP